MNIYVKSFNRPFCLDRCLSSIKDKVSGYDEVVVLDDGTLEIYLAKLKKLHPDVRFVRSAVDDHKYELVREQRFAEIRALYPDPATFWLDATREDTSDYLMLIEDDMWMVNPMDVSAIEAHMREDNSIACKFGWREFQQSGGAGVYRSIPLASGSLDYYTSNLSDMWEVWYPCLVINRLDYWLAGMTGIANVNDEDCQLVNAKRFIDSHPGVTHTKINTRCAYQGWAAPGRSDPAYYSFGITQHLFQDCLNDAWLRGELDTFEGYPHDFSIDYLVSCFEGHVPQEQIDVWRRWRAGSIWGNCTLYYNE